MKYVTRQERIGEELGPVDWNHPMVAEVAERRGDAFVTTLRDAEQSPEKFEATTDGGWPRIGWGRVIRVVMYDGWPYWQPTPTVVVQSWMGAEYHSFNAISDIREVSP